VQFLLDLWNTKFHFRVHNGPLLDPMLSQMKAVHNLKLFV